ncbi:D-beta-D-heptose 1-phosphate adenylyltransferase [bacterium HR15]|nr:D-beta-D-heptose 1-phosphate adenylyltransferase [bacterium HR15]
MASRKRQGAELETLETTIAQWKQAGKQVVLTAARFETLDETSIALLEQARALGDALIVVLHTELPDGQVKAEQMLALKCADAFTVLPEDALVPLLQRLQPPYYVLLGDYTERDLPAVEAVIAYGGFAVVLPRARPES